MLELGYKHAHYVFKSLNTSLNKNQFESGKKRDSEKLYQIVSARCTI